MKDDVIIILLFDCAWSDAAMGYYHAVKHTNNSHGSSLSLFCIIAH